MTNSRTALLLVLVTCLSSLSFAAETKPTSQHLAAEELLQMMHMKELMEQSTETMIGAMLSRLPQEAQQRDTLMAFFNKYVGWDALKKDFTQIYKEAFTEKELRDLIAFYKTPSGQKAIRTMPSLMQKGALIGQERVQAHLPELLQSLGIKQ